MWKSIFRDYLNKLEREPARPHAGETSNFHCRWLEHTRNCNVDDSHTVTLRGERSEFDIPGPLLILLMKKANIYVCFTLFEAVGKFGKFARMSWKQFRIGFISAAAGKRFSHWAVQQKRRSYLSSRNSWNVCEIFLFDFTAKFKFNSRSYGSEHSRRRIVWIAVVDRKSGALQNCAATTTNSRRCSCVSSTEIISNLRSSWFFDELGNVNEDQAAPPSDANGFVPRRTMRVHDVADNNGIL